MSPYISIIIPIYNVASYIENCLMSVVNQSYKNIEIILVDDCGKDNSIDIAKGFISSHSANWVSLVHDRNRGLSAARNTGVKHANGDYLFFLDSDDELPKNAINIFVQNLQNYGDADFLIGNYIIEGDFKFEKLATSTVLESTQEILNSYILGRWYVMACGKLIHRGFFLKNALWFAEHRLHEDELFSFRLALSASKMITVQEDIYKYIIRDNSITIAKKEKNYIDMFWMLTEKISLIQQNTILFNKMSSSAYIISMLFQFAISISISQLPYRKKCVFFVWMKKELKLIQNKHSTLKIVMEVLIMSLSPFVTITLCNLVDFIYKKRGLR